MRKQEPIKEIEPIALDEKRYTHPAFGLVSFSRVRGGDRVMFGSSIEHTDRIALRIKHADYSRGLSSDWYSGKNEIVEVEMSYSQFAECISSMNMGDGVPCTILKTEKDGVIPAIQENIAKRQQFRDEAYGRIENAMSSVQAQIDNILSSLSDKRNLGIKERQDMIRKLQIVQSDIGRNLEFVMEQFDCQMDKTVQEAKGEIEAFCQNKIASIAQQALVENKDSLQAIDSPIPIDGNLLG